MTGTELRFRRLKQSDDAGKIGGGIRRPIGHFPIGEGRLGIVEEDVRLAAVIGRRPDGGIRRSSPNGQYQRVVARRINFSPPRSIEKLNRLLGLAGHRIKKSFATRGDQHANPVLRRERAGFGFDTNEIVVIPIRR